MVDSGTSSVVPFEIIDVTCLQNFEKSMCMLYQRCMQPATLKKLIETPVQPHLHVGDPRLIPIFFSSSGLKRRGERTAALSPGDDEYITIRSRLITSLRRPRLLT